MTTIHELSRLAQLRGNGGEIFNKALVSYNTSIDVLADEILSRVESVPDVTFDESMRWYRDVHAFAVKLAEIYGKTPSIAAGIISAVSPRMPWLRNKNVAEQIIATYSNYSELSSFDAAKTMGLGLNSNVSMAIKIARGESIADILTGVKRRSFYNNIIDPVKNDSVTVDTWMMMAYCNSAKTDKKSAEDFTRANRIALGGTGAGYFAIAEATRKVAEQLNMTPSAVQAVYWTSVSGSLDGGRTDIG